MKFIFATFAPLAATLITLGATSALAATEWCPRHQNKFPAAMVDFGKYKIFYFTDDKIYNEDGQNAVVYTTKNKVVIDQSSADGESDWASTTEYVGSKAGFAVDSASFDLMYAWFIDETGARQDAHPETEARAPGYGGHELICAE